MVSALQRRAELPRADEHGRFRVEGIAPGLKFDLGFIEERQTHLPKTWLELKPLEAGQTPGWHELPANDLRALAAYVNSLESERSPAKTEPLLSTEEQVKAEKLYVTNCAMCHGPQGRGDGTAAGALAPKPTDFRQERPSLGYAEDVLARGVPGTAMPPWRDRLDAAQRHQLASYVRSLYQPASPSR
jgi:mono/diheme cytochrome c family protein